ncbi:hypothetical protein CYMTET_10992, partial [Cymbomonas tetramitiformis]
AVRGATAYAAESEDKNDALSDEEPAAAFLKTVFATCIQVLENILAVEKLMGPHGAAGEPPGGRSPSVSGGSPVTRRSSWASFGSQEDVCTLLQEECLQLLKDLLQASPSAHHSFRRGGGEDSSAVVPGYEEPAQLMFSLSHVRVVADSAVAPRGMAGSAAPGAEKASSAVLPSAAFPGGLYLAPSFYRPALEFTDQIILLLVRQGIASD